MLKNNNIEQTDKFIYHDIYSNKKWTTMQKLKSALKKLDHF